MRTLRLIFPLLAATAMLGVRLQAQVIVIANPNVKSATVSKKELREVFTGASSNLRDGSRVTPVLLKRGSVHNEFLLAYVGMNDLGLRAAWRSLLFSGQSVMPKSVESETAAVEYVAGTAGAIGYISQSTPHDGVKVMAVQ